jgi:hypothetical protein
VGRWVLGSSAHQGFSGLVTDPVQGIGIPFMLVGPMLAAVCVGIYVVVSLKTPPMDQKAVQAVCWEHPFAFLRGRLQGVSDPRVVALTLFTVVMCLYAIMH